MYYYYLSRDEDNLLYNIYLLSNIILPISINLTIE